MKEIEDSHLIVVPFQVSETEYDLLVLFRDKNLERLKAYDPAEVPMKHMPEDLTRNLKLRTILLGYATKEEIVELFDTYKLGGEFTPLLRKLSRGFTYRPDLSDSDDAPEQVQRPGRG